MVSDAFRWHQAISLPEHRRLVDEAVEAERKRCFDIVLDMLERMADLPVPTRAKLMIIDGMSEISWRNTDQS